MAGFLSGLVVSSGATKLAATLVTDMKPTDAAPILAGMGASDAANIIAKISDTWLVTTLATSSRTVTLPLQMQEFLSELLLILTIHLLRRLL